MKVIFILRNSLLPQSSFEISLPLIRILMALKIILIVENYEFTNFLAIFFFYILILSLFVLCLEWIPFSLYRVDNHYAISIPRWKHIVSTIIAVPLWEIIVLSAISLLYIYLVGFSFSVEGIIFVFLFYFLFQVIFYLLCLFRPMRWVERFSVLIPFLMFTISYVSLNLMTILLGEGKVSFSTTYGISALLSLLSAVFKDIESLKNDRVSILLHNFISGKLKKKMLINVSLIFLFIITLYHNDLFDESVDSGVLLSISILMGLCVVYLIPWFIRGLSVVFSGSLAVLIVNLFVHFMLIFNSPGSQWKNANHAEAWYVSLFVLFISFSVILLCFFSDRNIAKRLWES